MKRKTKKRIYFALGIFVFINFLIFFTGKTYLYKGLTATYLVGKTGPGIYDSTVFYTSKLQPSENPYFFEKTTLINLKDEESQYLSDLNTTSFLVIQNDKIIHESYFDEHNEEMRSNSFSMAKSAVAILTGIAIEEGYLSGLDSQIGKYLMVGEQVDVTIRHLLSMSSGLKWSESGSNPLSENAAAYYGRNLTDYMNHTSFSKYSDRYFAYASGNTQLLAMVLEKATRMKLSEFAETYLWKKIGAEHQALWSKDSKNGVDKAFCCLYATTKDYAKLGKLVLNKGNFNGNQIVSEEMMETLTDNATLKNGQETIPNYGLHFWLAKDKDEKIIYFRGILGQYIIVIPSKNLIVVRTGHNRGEIIKSEDDKNGHPEDLFEYIKIANRMAD